MTTLLIQQLNTAVTMTDAGNLQDVDILIQDGIIQQIGHNIPVPDTEDLRIIDGTFCVAYPGFINTHHHMYQTLTRNIPRVQDVKLFDWLINLYEIWRELTPEAVEVSTKIAVAELLLSGCTSSSDHFYVFPEDAPEEWIDIEIDTAAQLGIRFFPMRGSMSRSKKHGGLPPDDVVQEPDIILNDCQRVIDKYHDDSPYSMCRVTLAPCSPFSVTTDLMIEAAKLARANKVHLHTHLCETKDEEQFCLDTLGKRPLDYMEETGWVGSDVWYAHGIYFNDEEIKRLAETQTGIAHCPASNLRLGSGICQVPKMLKTGVPVSLAVDGSASNDSSNYVREMQMALLIHRVGTAVDAMPASNVLKIATQGGAQVLGHENIGLLAPGKAADLAIFNLNKVEYAGAMQDPASAILFCGAGARTDYTIVNGKVVVDRGSLADFDESDVVERANRITQTMITQGWEN